MNRMSQRRIGLGSLALLAVAFIAAVIVSNQLLKGWRIDLTENDLYTLSDGTKRILGKIDEPINLYFYYSDKATENLPSLRSYATRVIEMLEEFESRADGSIDLRVVDPVPFSEAEDRAAQFGLQEVTLGGATDPVYLGLAGTNSVGEEAVIPFFHPDKEEFLEYDIAKLVSSLAEPERTKIGLVSGIAMSGDFDPATRQMRPAWVIHQQAAQLFELTDLGTDFDAVPDDIGVLWIVQPKDLPQQTLYAIDQHVLGGGKALIFVDPLAEIDAAAPPQGMPPGMMPPQGQGSALPGLFEAWGLEFADGEVVADPRLALQISAGAGARPTRHPGLLGLTESELNQSDVITADLEAIHLGVAGYLAAAEGREIDFEPLLQSSPAAGTLPASRFSFLPDPSTLLDGLAAGDDAYVLAGRLTGNLETAFPDGPPAPDDDADDGDDADDADVEADGAQSPDDHLSRSAEPANLIIVADVDILSDRLWVQTQSFFGQQIATAFADNGNFVINALDSLSGSNDLIDVRSRASYSRPFSRVEALQADAEAKFRETEQRLQQELQETERRLTELQSSREDTGTILMTEQQQAEIDRFIDRRAEIRQELRAVRRNLDRDIERLGTALKIVNIGLVPSLLVVFVLAAVWRRQRRRGA